MSVIRNEIKTKLKLLNEFQPEVINEFCKLSHDYLINGPNEKKYGIAAKKLSTTSNEIQSIIESLICFTIDSIKNNATDNDFNQLETLNFNVDQIDTIRSFVNEKRNYEIFLKTFHTIMPIKYRDLEWRIEAKIASRTLLKQANTGIVIRLHLDSERINEHKDTLLSQRQQQQQKDEEAATKKNITKREVLFELDLINLSHIISTLEGILLESRTHRTRNFMKAFH